MVLVLFVIGRVIFGIYWLEVAYGHLFKNTAGLTGYAQSKGVKAAKAGVIVSGILALIGGLSILLGFWPRVGIAALVLFLLGTTFMIHTYWKVTDPQAKMMDRVQFMKNVAIIGALLMLLVMPIPWMWSL
jgi:putative oxidoreductase